MGYETKSITAVGECGERKWLGKSIGQHQMSGTMSDCEGAIFNSFVDEVMLYVDMFGAVMMTRFLRQVHSTMIVKKDGSWIRFEI